MGKINLLEFIHKTNKIYVPEFLVPDVYDLNLLDYMEMDYDFARRLQLGILFLNPLENSSYVLLDNYSTILSISLLLHAICECHKKTTQKNDKAINMIRKKYLFKGEKTKLQLPPKEQSIYNKILTNERLSDKEKRNPIFKILHAYWTQIKKNKYKAADIFKYIEKIATIVTYVDDVMPRDFYYAMYQNLNWQTQILLIEDYIAQFKIYSEWQELKNYFVNTLDGFYVFLKDFFVSRFNLTKFSESNLYEIFSNYFETMKVYKSPHEILQAMTESAKLYCNIINVEFEDERIKEKILNIKLNNGEDTFSFLLNVYEDYTNKIINEQTFIEILSAVESYTKKRMETQNDTSFDELIMYLNTFLTYK